ncbi:MAG TPA: hypothetical protein VM778_10510, partial [Gemmatimonadota bacterium]|nr:hypothetical protein [Gemmatimonadota bacterium]
STGIPTKTEQCDFHHAVHGGPGDAPRVVLAPFDVADCFHIGVQAFNLAEEFQTPVIVLSDQYVGQRKESVVPFDIHQWPVAVRRTLAGDDAGGAISAAELVRRNGAAAGNGGGPEGDGAGYLRYVDDGSGVSPMAIPGQPGGTHTVSGLEHVATGDPTSSAEVHARMSEKRQGKLDRLARERGPGLVRHFGAGEGEARLGVVCWGSTSAQVREAARVLGREGLPVRVCVPQLLAPLPLEPLAAFVASVERTLWVELNHQAQFHRYVRGYLDLPPERTRVHARSGGTPFTVGEIVDAIRRMAEEE